MHPHAILVVMSILKYTCLLFALCGLLAAPLTLHAQQQALPPVLVGPYDGSDVVDQLVVWTWFMQPTTSDGAAVTCELRCVELFDGQTPEEAFRSNPAVLVRSNLTSSAWQTNLAARSFQPGHRYVWRITAFARGRIVSESEIWRFTYAKPTEPGVLRSAVEAANARMQEGVEGTAAGTVYDAAADRSAEDAALDAQQTGEAAADASPGDAGDPAATPSAAEAAEASAVAPLRVRGRTRLTAETANRRGVLSENPARFARLQLDPRLEIFNAPFDFSAILTTEENVRRSTLNRGALGFRSDAPAMRVLVEQRIERSIEELEEQRAALVADSLRSFMLADTAEFDRRIAELQQLESLAPEQQIATLAGLGVLDERERALLDVPEIGFGSIAPRFSDLFFQNVTVTGGSALVNPGNLLVGATFGTLERRIVLDQVSLDPLASQPELGEPQFFRTVYAGRVGYGRRTGDHVMLSALYADDETQSSILRELLDTTGTLLTRQENYVLGLAGRWELDGAGLVLDGEVNTSLMFGDPLGATFVNRSLPTSLARVFGRDATAEGAMADVGYAARGIWRFDGESGRVFGGMRFVGPGYRSVGTAALRSDVISYDGGYEHLLLDRTLRLNGTVGRELSGFVDGRAMRTILDKLGASVDLRLPALPTLGLSYVVNVQKLVPFTDSLTNLYARIDQFGLSSTWQHRIAGMRAMTTMLGNVQKGNSSDSTGIFTSYVAMLSTRVMLADPLSVFVMLSRSHTVTHEEVDADAVHAADLALTWMPVPALSGTFGMRGTLERDRNVFGLFIEAQLDIGEHFTLQLRGERSVSADDIEPERGFAENIARFISVMRF
jgi:hypothetical protein